MTTITNVDTYKSREAIILTKPSDNLNWCVAAYEVEDGYWFWRFVRLQNSGKYTFNDTMYFDQCATLDEVKARAVRNGYELI
ncbi:MAG: hypothetical protein J0H18_15275 [Rhizobiales bacterium]|nr:hypothetical protein [Hyphomicrobiales bacterium]OJX99115.1 MAG: hypothetical protein BGP07_03400 [Rhizobiales bacterium 63-22]